MPNCFSLTRRSQPEAGPVSLSLIDSELCAALGMPCDAEMYHHGWYDYIGFLTAMGWDNDKLSMDIDKAAKECAEKGDQAGLAYWEHMERIRAWLHEHFTSDAWAEIGKR